MGALQVVEGNTCSVNSGDGGRGFRNRIGSPGRGYLAPRD